MHTNSTVISMRRKPRTTGHKCMKYLCLKENIHTYTNEYYNVHTTIFMSYTSTVVGRTFLKTKREILREVMTVCFCATTDSFTLMGNAEPDVNVPFTSQVAFQKSTVAPARTVQCIENYSTEEKEDGR